MCAWGSWEDEALAKQRGSTRTTRILGEERVHQGDENHRQMYVGRDGDSAICETQMYDADTCTQRNITRLAEEVEGGGWQQTSNTIHVMSPPMEEQTGGDVEDDALAGGTQMEMTNDGSVSGMQGPGVYMWSTFTSTVRDMAAPELVGGNSSKGWVQSKRGRPSLSVGGGGECEQCMVEHMSGHNNFNLNLSPEKSGTRCGIRGRGLHDTTSGRGPGSRSGGRAGGRGVGRVKRPLPVQPRYGTQASFQTTIPAVLHRVIFSSNKHLWEWMGSRVELLVL